MPGYISTLVLKFKHPHPTKPWLAPFKCLPIAYDPKAQLTPVPDTSELLNANHKCRIQEIVGVLLYYLRAVNNKLLVTLSTISACQSNTTVATEQAANLLLNNVAKYPNDGIACQSSNMILCAHADAGFLNKTKSRSRAGAHFSSRKMILSHVSMAPFSLLPKSSSLSWCQPLNWSY
jgi:hypothetical protein